MNRLNTQYFFIIIALYLPGLSYAETSWLDKTQIHGFASQAFIATTDNNFFGDSEHGSFEFTELGINASTQLSSKLRFSAQALSRRAGGFDDGSPRIDFALLDINLINYEQGQIGVYLGRIKNPIGLYNETRDVSHTRQGIFAAQSIYFDKVRDLILSADGIQLYGDYSLPNGTLFLRGGLGYSIPDENVEQAYLGANFAGKLESNKLALLGQILYEHDGGRWIFSATGVTLEIDYESQPADALFGISDGTLKVDYTVLSTQYNGEKWQLTGEVAFENINPQGISEFHQALNSNTLGYSLEANYRLTSKLQGFIRQERFYIDKDDKNGSQYNATYLQPASSRYSKSWVIGGRWDINPNWMARVEYHSFKGLAILSPVENTTPTAKENWDMFALSLSYRF